MTLRCDLHMHSCLSPCGDDGATPAALAGFCALAGLDVAALSDHNSTRNCPAFLEAAAAYGLVGLPAMELCTAEEVHVLCLLPDLDAARKLEEYVYARLPATRNKPEIFGSQLVVDCEDRVLAREEKLLLGAARLGVDTLPGLLKSLGGLAIPAHIDRDSFSLLSNLGFLSPELGFSLVELSAQAQPDALLAGHPELQGIAYIRDSDAHSLDAAGASGFLLEAEERSAEAVLFALKSQTGLPVFGK